MPISVECPACEREFHIPNSYGGKKGKCPECGKVFVAPAADSAKPPPHSRLQPPKLSSSDNGPAVPVPPPPQLAGRSAVAETADPPVTAEDVTVTNDAPPITEPPVAPSHPVQPPRSDQESRQKESPARRAKNTPLWIAVAVLSAMLVVCVFLLVKNMRLDGKELVSDNDETSKEKPAEADEDTDKAAAKTPVETAPKEGKLRDRPLNQLWDETRPAVFRLVAKGGEDNVTGLAFAIDEQGWLATSYQLVKEADAVEVSATGDPSTQSISATGFVASSAERNVAIIAIEQEPVATLNLEPASPKIGRELAVCRSGADGLELFEGLFHELASFDDLSANSRAIARQQGLDRNMNLVWLEHDQHLAPGDRGGPLMNLDGKVIGVNTRLSPDSKVGFALPVAYLMELVESAGDEVTPFAKDATQLAGNDTPVFGSKDVGPDDPLKPSARPEPGSLESIDAIRELHQSCKDIDWQPETPDEYGLLQDLAEYVYVAKVNEEDESIEEGLRLLIASPAQEVLVDLSKTRWPGEAGMKKLNALAAEGLKEPGKGIVCYVEIARKTRDGMSVDDVPAIVCELIGTEQAIVVPVKKDSPKLRRKTRWLLTGKHDPAQTLGLRADDGTEKEVPLIRAKHLLGEPKEKPPAKAPARRR